MQKTISFFGRRSKIDRYDFRAGDTTTRMQRVLSLPTCRDNFMRRDSEASEVPASFKRSTDILHERAPVVFRGGKGGREERSTALGGATIVRSRWIVSRLSSPGGRAGGRRANAPDCYRARASVPAMRVASHIRYTITVCRDPRVNGVPRVATKNSRTRRRAARHARIAPCPRGRDHYADKWRRASSPSSSARKRAGSSPTAGRRERLDEDAEPDRRDATRDNNLRAHSPCVQIPPAVASWSADRLR